MTYLALVIFSDMAKRKRFTEDSNGISNWTKFVSPWFNFDVPEDNLVLLYQWMHGALDVVWENLELSPTCCDGWSFPNCRVDPIEEKEEDTSTMMLYSALLLTDNYVRKNAKQSWLDIQSIFMVALVLAQKFFFDPDYIVYETYQFERSYAGRVRLANMEVPLLEASDYRIEPNAVDILCLGAMFEDMESHCVDMIINNATLFVPQKRDLHIHEVTHSLICDETLD